MGVKFSHEISRHRQQEFRNKRCEIYAFADQVRVLQACDPWQLPTWGGESGPVPHSEDAYDEPRTFDPSAYIVYNSLAIYTTHHVCPWPLIGIPHCNCIDILLRKLHIICSTVNADVFVVNITFHSRTNLMLNNRRLKPERQAAERTYAWPWHRAAVADGPPPGLHAAFHSTGELVITRW